MPVELCWCYPVRIWSLFFKIRVESNIPLFIQKAIHFWIKRVPRCFHKIMLAMAQGSYLIKAVLNCETFPTWISNIIFYGYVLSARHKKILFVLSFWVSHHLGVYERIDVYTVQKDLVGGRFESQKWLCYFT